MDNDVYQQLAGYFPPDRVHWRVGATWGDDDSKGGIALAYIDARDVMDRLDAVVGPERWADEYHETPSGRVICRLSIEVVYPGAQLEWVTKSDGAGATATEGEKGAISDAFKRAAVKWGIGRYLYDLPVVRVQKLVKRGRSWTLPDDFDGQQYLPCFQSKQMKTRYINDLKKAAADEDELAARQLWNELSNYERSEIWTALGPESAVRSTIKRLLKEAA